MKTAIFATMTAMVATASAQFVVYSNPYYQGYMQTFKETPGCYQLNGRYNVASFKGVEDSLYTFYDEYGCSGDVIYTSSYAPQNNIRPPIYRPRSVKILNGGSSTPYKTLVTYSGTDYHGYKQSLKGDGCQVLDGSLVRSFQGYGGYRYKFYSDDQCHSTPLLESKGGNKNNIYIKPSSVYIYKN
ncbi:hypothetical protein BGZ49_005176 [Haplosporangium sp. Z 27]|nr:hypothetical protein BGZ49_005176 [Haplosporangium sp. Z 27]